MCDCHGAVPQCCWDLPHAGRSFTPVFCSSWYRAVNPLSTLLFALSKRGLQIKTSDRMRLLTVAEEWGYQSGGWPVIASNSAPALAPDQANCTVVFDIDLYGPDAVVSAAQSGINDQASAVAAIIINSTDQGKAICLDGSEG